MRACKIFLALTGLALAIGAVQASSQNSVLRIAMTIVDRCDIRAAGNLPSVDCSAGVPWTVASGAAAAPSLRVTGGSTSHLPVPHSGPVDEAQVTTIVF